MWRHKYYDLRLNLIIDSHKQHGRNFNNLPWGRYNNLFKVITNLVEKSVILSVAKLFKSKSIIYNENASELMFDC